MAKTIRNLYYRNLTYEKLMEAHIKSRKGKMSKDEIITFNLKQEEYIKWLLEALKSKTYKHGEYKIFYIREPKLRKIERSRYIDRIVHRWYVDNFLYEYFIKQFIINSFACIKNRGTHKACLAVQQGMKHCNRIWGEYYILKTDVSKFFQNIDKDILMEILERKIKYYYRFMDDSVILVKTKKEAKEVLEKIKKFLKEKLELELNKKTQIFKSKQGVNFCGYKINEYRMKIRDKGKRSLKKKIKHLKSEIQKGKMTSREAKKYLAGHLGYLKIANVKNLKDKLFYSE